MKARYLTVVVVLIVGSVLIWQRSVRTRLSAELATLRAEKQILRNTEEEDRRLQTNRERTASAASSQASEMPAPAPVSATTLALGRYVPAASLQDRGSATPTAALETALWAAVGGDSSTLAHLLLLDDALRSQVAELISRWPETSRAPFSTPESFLAALTIKQIPVGKVQLVWFNQTTPQEATAGIFLENPEVEPVTPQPVDQASVSSGYDRAPPMFMSTERTTAAMLTLRHTDAGWRLVVPASAITRLTRDLTTRK